MDERFNGGGSAANYIIDYMRRPLMNRWATREGEDFSTPANAIFGPKAMIINEMAGSGGDMMPWLFKKAGIGPLVGKRTWGGLVGIYDYPSLMDGGTVTAPRVAFYNLEGQWDVENNGTPADVEVELDSPIGHRPPPRRARVPGAGASCIIRGRHASPVHLHHARPAEGRSAQAGDPSRYQPRLLPGREDRRARRERRREVDAAQDPFTHHKTDERDSVDPRTCRKSS